MEKLKADIVGLEDKVPEVSNVVLEELTLTFTVGLLGGDYAAAVLMPEEYPSGEPTNMEDYSLLKQGSAVEVAQQMVDLYRQRERSTMYQSGSFLSGDQDVYDEDSGEEDDGGYSHACADGIGLGHQINQTEMQAALDELERDVAHFKRVYGANIGVHFDEMRRQHVIRLALPLTFLGPFHSSSLFLDPGKRLVIELHWGWAYFNSQEIPQLRNIYLTSEASLDQPTISDIDDQFGVVRWYLENRFNNALRLNWLTRKEGRARSRTHGGTDPDARGVQFYSSAYKKKPTKKDDEEDEEAALKKVCLSKHDIDEIEAKAKMLMSAGWDRRQCLMVLAESKLKVDVADKLFGEMRHITEQSREKTEEEWFAQCAELKKREKCKVKDVSAAGSPCGFNNADAMRFTCKYEDFFEDGSTNILNGMLRYLKYRMVIISQNCIICDKMLGFECVKTAVCDAPTCEFALEQFGIGCNPLAELQRSGVLVDLMLSLTATSVNSSAAGNRDSFNPWCERIEVPDSYLTGKLAKHKKSDASPLSFRDGTSKDFELIKAILNKLPPVSRMAECQSKADLRELLDEQSPLCFPLLQWTLSSNRSHLMRMEKCNHIPGLGDYQFVLCASNPEKERRFRERRTLMKKSSAKSRGTFWAWHGSGTYNWHAILRLGLKNYSNTSMMSAGAAHGPGIYLAKDISTSLGYMREPLNAWKSSAIGSMQAIALCEVVDECKLPNTKCHDHGGVYVVEDEDIVCTRFLFLFTNNFTPSGSLNADTIPKPQSILKLFEE